MTYRLDYLYLLGAILLFIFLLLLKGTDDANIRGKDLSPFIINLSAAAIRDGDEVIKLANESKQCASNPVWRLATAIAISENYFRNQFRRRAELLYAWLHLNLTGSLPSLSLGLTQIQPASARQALEELGLQKLNDNQLFDLMKEEKSNFLLSYGYLLHLRKTLAIEDINENTLEFIARKYNGATETLQTKLYSLMIKSNYSRLQFYDTEKSNRCMQLTIIPLHQYLQLNDNK